MEDFNIKLMEEIADIEDAAKAGREMKICPYYGSRYSIPTMEIVALPYNILFHRESRKSFSINLKNQIVIIDEAHNLFDTISSIHSVEISDICVSQAIEQLNNYITKYKSRFTAKNYLYLKHLQTILNGLNKLLKQDNQKTNNNDTKKVNKIWSVNEFLVETRFFNLNFVKILRFCDETKLENKVNLQLN
jgi:chromosome transmission fidelity protein 1